MPKPTVTRDPKGDGKGTEEWTLHYLLYVSVMGRLSWSWVQYNVSNNVGLHYFLYPRILEYLMQLISPSI